ncbi:caspase-8-like [Scleropages formosus]|uniref:Caspase-8 n=1 Tax=Scleropages formosus TaxID=113540 RepID=A0A0P7W1I0_SCLFO|nr:caspase-8-like [Scleropages formosus]
MDLTSLLHKVSEELGSDEVAALKFLCKDAIQRKKLETVRDGRDLFLRLAEQGLLDDVSGVAELLLAIKRYDLLRQLGTSRQETEHRLQREGASIISDYRKLLYEVSEDVTTDNLEAVKFLSKLPRTKLDSCKSFLDVLVEMEKMELLAEGKLEGLVEILKNCNPELASKNEMYCMRRRPRGRCLIINNYSFNKARMNNLRMGDRKGTDVDAVTQRKDLTGDELLEVLQKFGKMDHSQLDAFVCCILSHGEKRSVMGTDGKVVPIWKITQPFISRLCPSLAGKPKLFFIQACQGQKKQMGALIQADGEGNDYEMDASHIQPDVIPDDSDFLLGMATVEDYQSFRNTREGSIFIQELCRQLRNGCPRNENILDILTRVNREVSSGLYMNFKQMPEPRYTLTKTLILPVS